MPNEKFTQLPTVASATLNDIICAVQGGISSQETLSQVYGAFATNLITPFAGNPNGNVAGTAYQNLVWDTSGSRLFICTTTGTTSTAVWTSATSANSFEWNEIVVTSANMTGNNGYIANNAALVTLTLPVTSSVGQIIEVIGKGAGGWQIAQNAGQSITFGTVTTTIGGGGSLASSQDTDGVRMVCTTADTVWTVMPGPIGNITYV